ncbi:MAG: electron transfer flavoprotein subunit alpha [Dehalococcoidales bacterium]|nr:electron transfer flavoprotein subunit alpha [Dehalococcoidales bacterium]
MRLTGVAQLKPGKCIACGGRCQAACPEDAIQMLDNGEPLITAEKCIGCKKCTKACPSDAIEMHFTPEQLEALAKLAERKRQRAAAAAAAGESAEAPPAPRPAKEYTGVWVFVEQTEGQAARVSWELLGVGAELAKKLDVELCSVVIGDNVEALCHEAFSYGASKAYLIDDPVFRYYRTEPYYKALYDLIGRYKPEIVLVGATGLGRDLAGAVATTLKTGLTADCTGLTIDEEGLLIQTRPAFGGNIMASILTERTRPQMATVRPRVMALPERDPSRQGEIVRATTPFRQEDFLTRVLEIIDTSHLNVDVTAADVIVSGGRGMGCKENFHVLQELADELGGVVAASRGAVDAGWMPAERQVGQTGKTVRPILYVACGIRGAIQHLVGMQSSDIIIGINKDKHAPIFEVATYGIVGDVLQVVPALTKQVRELRAKKTALRV